MKPSNLRQSFDMRLCSKTFRFPSMFSIIQTRTSPVVQFSNIQNLKPVFRKNLCLQLQVKTSGHPEDILA